MGNTTQRALQEMRLDQERKKLFGKRLKQAAIARYGREHGIVSRVSEDMGVSAQTASKWLQGITTPDPDRWGEIATTLNVSVSWLTGASHEHPKQVQEVDKESTEAMRIAVKVVHPLVQRMKPDATSDEVYELFREAYDLVMAGKNEKEVSGHIVSKII